jgi:DNA-binding PadR family transcriptional regulator
MSLRFGVLGLLAGEPASGYDLARRFEEALADGAEWAQTVPPAR